MTHLYEVVNHDELLQGVLDGYIREQTHPTHLHYRKVVWRAVSEGPHKVGELIGALPDEFHDYVRDTARELQDAYGARVRGIDAMYVDVLHEPEVWSMHGDGEQHIDRPKFAAAAKRIAGRDASYMFALLDGKDIQSKVWAELEPKGGEL